MLLISTMGKIRADLALSNLKMMDSLVPGEQVFVWKVSNTLAKRVMMTDDIPFSISSSMVEYLSDKNGYYVQKNALLLFLSMNGEEKIVITAGADSFGLINNQKAIEDILKKLADKEGNIKESELYGLYADENKKILYLVNKIVISEEELSDIWSLLMCPGHIQAAILCEKHVDRATLIKKMEIGYGSALTHLSDHHVDELTKMILSKAI